MIIATITIYVKPEFIDAFILATIENHRNSIKEPGVLRFDVLQCADDPSRFLLYEAYTSPEAIDRHKETDHYFKWRDTVENWMANPREAVMLRLIAPESKSVW